MMLYANILPLKLRAFPPRSTTDVSLYITSRVLCNSRVIMFVVIQDNRYIDRMPPTNNWRRMWSPSGTVDLRRQDRQLVTSQTFPWMYVLFILQYNYSWRMYCSYSTSFKSTRNSRAWYSIEYNHVCVDRWLVVNNLSNNYLILFTQGRVAVGCTYRCIGRSHWSAM